MELSCWCLGADLRTQCEDPATQEDGLCDGCRTARCEGQGQEYQEFLEPLVEKLGLPPMFAPLREARNV